MMKHQPQVFSVARLTLTSMLFLLAGGCGGERRTDQKAAPPGGQERGTPPPAAQETAPAPQAERAPVAPSGGKVTPELVALGDKIFRGQEAGGTCATCHGQDAKGTPLAPDLTDSQWLNGDGSLEFIVKAVTSGVPKPKQHPAPMPPMGGASLTPEQVRAVAAYVYSLSHKSG